MERMEFSQLPDEIILHIFSLLDYKDLHEMLFVSKRCSRIARTESLWESLCKKCWALRRSDIAKETWRKSFEAIYTHYGRYVSVYAKIVPAWRRLCSFLRDNCPSINSSFDKIGLSEKEIDDVIGKYPVKLPDSLRLFYRLCSGQNLKEIFGCPGLFGSAATYTTSRFRTFWYVGLSTELAEIKPCGLDPKGEYLTEIAPPTGEEMHPAYYTVRICVDAGNRLEVCVLLPANNAPTLNAPFKMPADCSIIGKMDTNVNSLEPARRYYAIADTFEDWFVDFVEKTVTGYYPVEDGHILRYNFKPECVARTGHVTVVAGWAHSRVERTSSEEKMIFEYRITMSMDKDAPESESCQLMERHWFIEDFSDGSKERISGQGVVGEYPVMKPGASFSWMSRTCFKPPGGSMRGHFTMRSLRNSEKIEIECPKYVMDYPRIYGPKT